MDRWRFILLLLLASGCTKVPAPHAEYVSSIVETRIDSQVEWYQGCSSDEPDVFDQELTAEGAMQIALLNNPDIQATLEDIGIAHADLVEAGLLHNPVFDGFIRFPDKKHATLNTEFSLAQNFIDLLLIPLRKKIAETEFEQTQLKVAQTILNIAFDVQETYYRLQAEQAKLVLLKPLVEALEAASQLSQGQRDAGNVNALEFHSRQAEFLEAKLELSASQESLIRLREHMNQLLGIRTPESCWTMSDHLPELPKGEISLDCLEEVALSQRLDLDVARWEVERLARTYGIKQWWTYTGAALGVSSERDSEGIRATGPTFSLELPLFNYGQADRARIQALFRQSVEKLNAKEISVLSEVRAARDRLVVHRERVMQYEKALIPLQEQMVSMSEQYYNAMALSVYKLLQAKKQQLQTQIYYNLALRDYWIARVELNRALGGYLPQAEDKFLQADSNLPLKPIQELEIESSQEKEERPPEPEVKDDLPYVPVVTPNGSTLPWTLEDGVKVFHLVAEPVKREFAPGMIVNCWGYNGQTPGPTIEAVEGDRVRILVTNKLPEATTVHWHGILLPNGMDGVTGLNQKPIPPGETFRYEFTLRQSGTHMYHPHYDEMTQIAMGLMGFFIIHPKDPTEEEIVDRDFAILLHEWAIPIGASTPNPTVMLDFNYFTFNSKVWPGTDPLVVKKGQKVRIRLGNLSMDSHPIHLHGYEFTVVAQGAKRMKPSAQYEAVTINVPVGDTKDIEFVADEPGDWAFHCHKVHHTMNGMEHDIPNLVGVYQGDIEQKVRTLLPQYRAMGSTGMGEMFHRHNQHHTREGPPNYLRLGSPGPFGVIELSGMFTVLKVREGITNYSDPGWYQNPPGTVADKESGVSIQDSGDGQGSSCDQELFLLTPGS